MLVELQPLDSGAHAAWSADGFADVSLMECERAAGLGGDGAGDAKRKKLVALATFVPRALASARVDDGAPEPLNLELVLIVDCSGSMMGPRIEQVSTGCLPRAPRVAVFGPCGRPPRPVTLPRSPRQRPSTSVVAEAPSSPLSRRRPSLCCLFTQAREAALYFIKDLPSGRAIKFDVVCFGSTVISWSGAAGCRDFDEANMKSAVEWVQQNVHANLGGTEILETFKHVYRVPVTPGFTRQVVFMTGERGSPTPHARARFLCGAVALSGPDTSLSLESLVSRRKRRRASDRFRADAVFSPPIALPLPQTAASPGRRRRPCSSWCRAARWTPPRATRTATRGWAPTSWPASRSSRRACWAARRTPPPRVRMERAAVTSRRGGAEVGTQGVLAECRTEGWACAGTTVKLCTRMRVRAGGEAGGSDASSDKPAAAPAPPAAPPAVHCLGIGYGVHRGLLDGIARRTGACWVPPSPSHRIASLGRAPPPRLPDAKAARSPQQSLSRCALAALCRPAPQPSRAASRLVAVTPGGAATDHGRVSLWPAACSSRGAAH